VPPATEGEKEYGRDNGDGWEEGRNKG